MVQLKTQKLHNQTVCYKIVSYEADPNHPG